MKNEQYSLQTPIMRIVVYEAAFQVETCEENHVYLGEELTDQFIDAIAKTLREMKTATTTYR